MEMSRRSGAPRRWARSLARRRSCIQSCRPKPGRTPRGFFFLVVVRLVVDLMGRVVSFMVVKDCVTEKKNERRKSDQDSDPENGTQGPRKKDLSVLRVNHPKIKESFSAAETNPSAVANETIIHSASICLTHTLHTTSNATSLTYTPLLTQSS